MTKGEDKKGKDSRKIVGKRKANGKDGRREKGRKKGVEKEEDMEEVKE